MGSLSRSQLIVYGAVAVVLLLVGARWIRSGEADGAPAGEVTYSDSSSGAPGGDTAGTFAVDAEGGTDVVVDVAGAVGDPGVYRLPGGSRVDDAVQRAGGATAKAQIDSINLAARLTDGQQVVVPEAVGGSTAVATGVAGTAAADSTTPISVGTASLEDLDTIEGIGPVTAQAILDFRDQQGGLSSVDQLDEVDGIGPATMEALRSRLQP